VLKFFHLPDLAESKRSLKRLLISGISLGVGGFNSTTA
jgi:hypothetical protein